MPRTTRTFSRQTVDAAQVLGLQVAQGRRERRWTVADLAARAGITANTLRKVERGDPTVALGTALEAAWLVGVPLFGAEDRAAVAGLVREGHERLALLPARIRSAPTRVPSGDF